MLIHNPHGKTVILIIRFVVKNPASVEGSIGIENEGLYLPATILIRKREKQGTIGIGIRGMKVPYPCTDRLIF